MGKYAIFLVLSMIFGMITYEYSVRQNMIRADSQITRDYNVSHSKNIAQSIAYIAFQKIADPDDEEFNPENDETYSIPENQDQFLFWNDMLGEYRIDIENRGDSLLILTSTARVDEIDYKVSVSLDRSSPKWDPFLNHAVFAGTSLDLTGSSAILGDTGTNAVAENSVSLSGNPRIHGELQIGPVGFENVTVSYPGWAAATYFIDEGISNMPAPLEYELPPFPLYPSKVNIGSNILLEGSSSLTMIPGSYDNIYIPEISVRSNTTLTINSGGSERVLHVGNLDIQQGHINITGGGDLTLYVEDGLTLNGSSSFNNGSEKSTVLTHYKGIGDIDFGGSTTFNSSMFVESADIHLRGSGGIQGNIITGGDNVTIYGNAEATSKVLYAPKSFVDLRGSGRIRGAVISDTFQAVGNARVFYDGEYDEELPEFESDEVTYKIFSWY